MSKPKSELSAKFKDLFERTLRDPDAIELWWLITNFVQHMDDIYDADTQDARKHIMECTDIALVKIPSNLFFQRYCNHIVPAVRHCLYAWEHATLIEEQARGSDGGDYRLLLNSYELRNDLFDLALLFCDILHGREARRSMALEFMEISRDYEDFPVYTAKVTAAERPAKEDT